MEETQSSIIRFSLAKVPARARRETLTEVFGRNVANIDFQPLSERQRFEFEVHLLPGAAVTWGMNSEHTGATCHDRSRGSDDLVFASPIRPAQGIMVQRGREAMADGSGILYTDAEPLVGRTGADFHFLSVRLARRRLAELLPAPEANLMRPVPADNEALQLLKRYLAILRSHGPPRCAELAHAAALHVADLVALALGTTRDAAEYASCRGLRAARIASVKAWILHRISEPDICVAAVALAHRISPRYVQMLFAHEGTSFSTWLRMQRLSLARRRLADPSQLHQSIGCIAFNCGFSDLSWFNRAFRQAYGETPSDVRHRATLKAPR